MASKNNTKEVSLAAIGEKLRAAREKKGVTIDQAQRQTHIHSTVLSAMETGRSDEVLTPTYVRSFLKKYASYLELDSNQLVREYAALHPDIGVSSSSLRVDGAMVGKRSSFAGILRMAGKACIIAACMFLLVIMVRGAISLIKSSHKPSTAKARVQAKKTRAIPVKTTAKNTADPAEAQQISIPDKEPITLIMRVKADVYVGVKRDGVLLFKRSIPKGTIETFTADKKLNISIAKARSVELVLNGRPLGAVAKGAIQDLEITRKGIKVK